MLESKVSRQGNCQIMRRQSFLLLVPLALMLAFVLGACGSNGGTTTTGGGSTPTPPPKSGTTGTTFGCPNNTVVGTSQRKPNVIVGLTNSHSTVIAHNGDLIEVRLPFGQQWAGPAISQGVLQVQQPAGYASMSDKMCIWHFVAQGTGTTQLNFTSRAICKKGQLCPQYVLDVPFTIDVK